MATKNKPGIFHLPRPSYQDRRSMQSQPAQPPTPMGAPSQVGQLPSGQPNMNLSEPILGIGERTGQQYFRAGEVPERITFEPTQPGTPPVPPPAAGAGTSPWMQPPQPAQVFNQFGQYRPPAPYVQPAQESFASGGSVQVNPSPTGGAPQGSMISQPPQGDMNMMLTQYLQGNPSLAPQDQQDLVTATQGLTRDVGLGKLSPEDAQSAFTHFTSSFAPPAPTGPQPMPQGGDPSVPPDGGQAPPDNFGQGFSTPAFNAQATAESGPVTPQIQAGMNQPVAPTNLAPNNAINTAPTAPPNEKFDGTYGNPMAMDPGSPDRVAAEQAAAQPPGPAPAAAPRDPRIPPGYGQGAPNRVPGNPPLPILPNSPRANSPADKGPAHPMPGATNPITGGSSTTNLPSSNFSTTGSNFGSTTPVQDYVHGGSAQFDVNAMDAIMGIFPPELQRQALYIAAAESKGNNGAIGTSGEVGLFQIHPVNWPGLTKALGVPVNADTLKDPNLNATAALYILQHAGNNWEHDWTTAKTVLTALRGS